MTEQSSDPIALGLLPEGFRDRLPPRAGAAVRVTTVMLEAIRPHGYDRVAPPLVEFEESLVSRLAGTETQDLLRLIAVSYTHLTLPTTPYV